MRRVHCFNFVVIFSDMRKVTARVASMNIANQDIYFFSETKGMLDFEHVLKEIVSFVANQPDRFYKIIIGSDSEATKLSRIVTAVTIWRVGNGAIHFWTKTEEKKFGSMRDRIWQEAISSIMLAQEFRSRLGDTLGTDFFWEGNEIHVDIGPNGPTKELIDSVVGMIKGYNFTPVIKPYSFGASIVADRHT